MTLFYLSFCTPGAWLGAAFVEAESIALANRDASLKGIAPGGADVQVLAFQYTGLQDVPKVPEDKRNRLLKRDELLALWPDAADLMEYEDHVS